MANENRPNTNQSQFFITLSPCEWLNRKHTIFGKITGNTIFNVLKLGEVEVGPNDRPLDTIRITSVEVLWNPFDDITPRFVRLNSRQFISSFCRASVVKTNVVSTNQKRDSKKERKGAKDLKLLSFGDDEPTEADPEIEGETLKIALD
jgi:peptidyl-prolyl cis-trans isomerase SDCCAG10